MLQIEGRKVILGWLIGIVFWGGVVCGCREEKSHRPEPPSKKAMGDDNLKQAQVSLADNEYEKAIKLAFAGYKKWHRRAGGRAGKMHRYLRIIHEVGDNGGAEYLVNMCVLNENAHEDRLCEKIILDHLQRGAVERRGYASALSLYKWLCEERREDLLRFHDLCAKLPEGFVLMEEIKNRILKVIDERCAGEVKDISLRSMCNRFIVVLWDHACREGKDEEISVLAPRLVKQGGVWGAKRLLQELGSESVSSGRRRVLERVFLQNAGELSELNDIVEAFIMDLSRAEKRVLVKRYVSLLQNKLVETLALAAQLEEATILRLKKSVLDLEIEGLSKLFANLESRLDNQPGVVLSRYLSSVGKDSKMREKVMSLLRNEPEVVQRRLVSKIAYAPLPQRDKYRLLLTELKPRALSGGVTGRVIPEGGFQNVDLTSCKIQLVEVKTCDERDPVKPERRGKKTGSGKGDGERARRITGVEDDGSFEFDDIPAGPYDAFISCRGRISWKRFRFGGYVKKSDDSDDRVWEDRCVVTVQPMKKVAMTSLYFDYSFRQRKMLSELKKRIDAKMRRGLKKRAQGSSSTSVKRMPFPRMESSQFSSKPKPRRASSPSKMSQQYDSPKALKRAVLVD